MIILKSMCDSLLVDMKEVARQELKSGRQKGIKYITVYGSGGLRLKRLDSFKDRFSVNTSELIMGDKETENLIEEVKQAIASKTLVNYTKIFNDRVCFLIKNLSKTNTRLNKELGTDFRDGNYESQQDYFGR